MDDDELKRLWQSQPLRPRLTVEAEVLLRQLQRNQKHFATWHFWGDLSEITGAALGFGLALYLGCQTHLWPVLAVAVSCLWVGSFVAVDLVRQRRRRPCEAEPLLACVEDSLAQVRHRLWLARNALWWYLLPVEAAVAFGLAAFAWLLRESSGGLIFVGAVTMVCAAVFAAVHVLIRHSIRKDLEPRLQEWEAMLANLRANGAGPLPPEGLPTPLGVVSRPSVVALWVRRSLLTAIVAGLAVFLVWRRGVTREVNRLLQAVAAAGYPTDARQLQVWYPAVPNADNAALLYADGFALFDAAKSNTLAWSDSRPFDLPRRGALPATNLQAQIPLILTSQSNTLELLHRAARLPKAHYALDLSQPFDTKHPHLEHLREFERLLAMETLDELAAGRPRRAVASVRASFALGRSLAPVPALLEQMVRWSLDAATCRGLERVLNRVALTEAELEALRADLTAADQPESLVRALAGDRAVWIQYFRLDSLFLLASSDALDPPTSLDPFTRMAAVLGRGSGFFERDLAYYLDSMQAAMAAAKLPGPESGRVGQQVAARRDQAHRKLCFLSDLALPPLERRFDQNEAHLARLRTAQTALALERYRLVHAGQLPATLAALVPQFLPAVPTDPFDGHPLRYRLLPKGYAVYSIGSDAKDDGGVERKPRQEGGKPTDPDDLVFRVER